MRNTTFRYFLYARKSSESEDRQMASIEDQIKEAQKLAERYGIRIIDIISESKSAKEPGRPLFNQMLQRIHKGEADGILTWKLNRLARNPIDGGQISWMLQQNIIKHIQTFERDYNPSDNVLLMQVEFGMANQYVKDLSIDVKRGMRQKAERGWYPIAILPLGYMHNPIFVPGIDQEIIPNEKQYPILKKVWQLFLSGKYSISGIKKKGDVLGLRNRNNRILSRSSYYFILNNEFYSGYYYWKDKDGNMIRYHGKHKPMISQNDFQRSQAILLGKPICKSRENKYNFPFRGLIKCGECGSTVTPDRKLQAICTRCKYKFSMKNNLNCPRCNISISEMKNPNIIDILYYHCGKGRGKCSQGSVTKEMILIAIKKSLKEISITHKEYLWGMNKSIGNERDIAEAEKIVSRLKKKASDLKTRLIELVTLLADRKINTDQFNLTTLQTQKEISEIEFQISEIIDRKIDWCAKKEKDFDFTLNALKRFQKGNDSVKTEILKELSSNLTLIDKKLEITTKKSLLEIKSDTM